MRNFFYNGRFYSDMDELTDSFSDDYTKEQIEAFDNDWKLEIELTDKEPIGHINAEWIAERFDEERFSEDNSDGEFDQIIKVLNENIDFKKINSQLPELYYCNSVKGFISKQEILSYF